jgi:hypothetical protein
MTQLLEVADMYVTAVLDDMSNDCQRDSDMIERDEMPERIYKNSIKVHSDRILESLSKVLSDAIRDRMDLLKYLGLNGKSISNKEITIEMQTLFQRALNRSIFDESY